MIAVLLAGILLALCTQLALHAHAHQTRPRPAAPPGAQSPEYLDKVKSIVHAAVHERLEHERERPNRYPPDHRHKSVFQRALRRMHFGNVPEPDHAHLHRLVGEEIKKSCREQGQPMRLPPGAWSG